MIMQSPGKKSNGYHNGGVSGVASDGMVVLCLFCFIQFMYTVMLLMAMRGNELNKRRDATPWARVANFVKKPPLIVNVTYLKLNFLMHPCGSLEL